MERKREKRAVQLYGSFHQANFFYCIQEDFIMEKYFSKGPLSNRTNDFLNSSFCCFPNIS